MPDLHENRQTLNIYVCVGAFCIMDVPSYVEKDLECEIRADSEKYYKRPAYYEEEDEFDVNNLSLSSHS